MAKYVNKDEVYGIVLHYGSYAASAKIADMDSIELVRCGECKYFNHAIVEINLNSPNKQHHEWDECELHDITPDPNWFCADGERKEAEHEV